MHLHTDPRNAPAITKKKNFDNKSCRPIRTIPRNLSVLTKSNPVALDESTMSASWFVSSMFCKPARVHTQQTLVVVAVKGFYHGSRSTVENTFL